MKDTQSFIPRDKPRFWVLGVLAALSGLFFGLVAFISSAMNLPMLKNIFVVPFMACWLVFAISWLGFLFGLLTGRYHQMEPRPWSEQVW
jgi:hypothetical protein